MSVTYTCDGCGASSTTLRSFKPADWFQQTVWFDKDGQLVDASLFGPRKGDTRGLTDKELHACSRPCIAKAAKRFGTHDLVAPF